MVNFGPLVAEIGSVVWDTQENFNGFRVLASLLHGIRAIGVCKTCVVLSSRDRVTIPFDIGRSNCLVSVLLATRTG